MDRPAPAAGAGVKRRVLAIDVGEVRLGLALSDPLGLIAQPLPHVPAAPRPQALAAIGRLCRERDVGELVIGLPRQKDGSEGAAAALARRFGAALAAEVSLPLTYIDERLSTREVERVLIEADLSRRRRRESIDGMAASIILQRFLARRPDAP